MSPGIQPRPCFAWVLAGAFIATCWVSEIRAAPSEERGHGFIGSEVCASCHEAEHDAWQGSHHQQAMAVATDATVVGDFDDAMFTANGITTRFFREDGRYMVNTDGPDGESADFEVTHTFGVYPLQQYLVPFPGGRLQTLDIAWDARPEGQGGQRWYHLHPDEEIRAGDVLHWTGPNLNWNYMCADCHSTNLRKGYDATSDSYGTTWSEISVGCEACHGPGRDHVDWAVLNAAGAELPADKGLAVILDERDGVSWAAGPDGLPVRSSPRKTDHEIQVCARCHSRRAQLADTVSAGDPLMDGFRPSLVSPGLYHPDGQVLDEVYVWGSFLQSRMEHAGVTCSDCHDPHSAEIRLPGNATCAQCHAPSTYDGPQHHFHEQGSAAAECTACHMPVTTFMGVDDRHEHAFRVPRPDLSVSLETPNSCNACHADQDPRWAAEAIERHHGPPDDQSARFARAMAGAWTAGRSSAGTLRAISVDESQPIMLRASALAALAPFPDADTMVAVERGMKEDDPLMRMAALYVLETMRPPERVTAFTLLDDGTLAVRVGAAGLLAPIPAGDLPAKERAMLESAIAEYVAVQQFNAERPEARASLGALYAALRKDSEAEAEFRRALELQPAYVPARVNLAQFLAETGREAEGAALLDEGLELLPGQPDLNSARGLSLVRQGRYEESVEPLRLAAEGAPENVYHQFVYAMALDGVGQRDASIARLEQVDERFPGNVDVLMVLTNFHREAGNLDKARLYAAKLVELEPNNPQFRGLLRSIQDSN